MMAQGRGVEVVGGLSPFLVSMVMGWIVVSYLAIRAARLSPTDALRGG